MKRIAIVLGRGTEGCGVTQCALQMQKASGADIYSTIDKKWPRAKGIEMAQTVFTLANDEEWPKIADQISSHYDMCVIYSVPSKSHPQGCQDNFVPFLRAIKTRKVFINVDHKIQSITRNANLKEVCESVDIMMTHSLKNPFAEWTKKNGVKTPLVKMDLGFDYDGHRAKYWKPINEQVLAKTLWIGRTTGWKGPQLMMDFHETELMDKGFITVLEGLEASIGYTGILYRDKEKTDRRKVVNYFRPEKEYEPDQEKFGPHIHGTEQRKMGSYLYPPYQNAEAMERMSLSPFGADLYHLKAEIYGNNIENCHAEIVACGSVPIFHKHFCDNVIHKVQGKPISECINTGTIGLDSTNFEETAKTMIKLVADPGMRDDWREQAFEFWKEHSNGEDVIADIIRMGSANLDKPIETDEEPEGLEGFFV